VQTIFDDRPTPAVRPRELLIGIAALSAMCGWSIRTTRRKLSAGLIPRSLHVGGSVRWRLAEVEEWVRAGCPAQQGGAQGTTGGRRPRGRPRKLDREAETTNA
jgi:predicted DNA-binding transcriptional regulator AlpA